jgi:hypothetical protein
VIAFPFLAAQFTDLAARHSCSKYQITGSLAAYPYRPACSTLNSGFGVQSLLESTTHRAPLALVPHQHHFSLLDGVPVPCRADHSCREHLPPADAPGPFPRLLDILLRVLQHRTIHAAMAEFCPSLSESPDALGDLSAASTKR